jgi:Rrf2 family iron-sulfur cluster assembly transcriptional regulator
MQLTREGEYGIRSVLHLAACGDGGVASSEEIARQQDIPLCFLRKILQALARSGLVRSRRGAHGGFALATPADSITLLSVIEAVEGPVMLNTCVLGVGECQRERVCPVHPLWREAQDRLVGVLRSTTMADLLASQCGQAFRARIATPPGK